MIDDANLKEFIESNWVNLCMVAYRNFLEMGRGLIGLKLTANGGSRDAKMVYGCFCDTSQVDEEVLKMIASYNPETEFLLQYMSPAGKVRTLRIQSNESRTPKEVWEDMKDVKETGN